MADSTITVTGNITRDPELKFSPQGKAICSFGLAVNRRFQRDGEWTESTSYMNVTAWDQLGENIAASLAKGARVVVSGRLDVREYERRDGTKGTSVDITANEVGASLRWATVQVERNPRNDGFAAAAPQSNAAEIAQAFAPAGDNQPF